jgi:hypothetical protein
MPIRGRAGETAYTPRPETLTRFLNRLSGVISFDDYDRLTREVWVAHMRRD